MKFIIPMYGDENGNCDYVFVSLSEGDRQKLLAQRELFQMVKSKDSSLVELNFNPPGDWAFISRTDVNVFGDNDGDVDAILSERQFILLEENSGVLLPEDFELVEELETVVVDLVHVSIQDRGVTWVAYLEETGTATSREIIWEDLALVVLST